MANGKGSRVKGKGCRLQVAGYGLPGFPETVILSLAKNPVARVLFLLNEAKSRVSRDHSGLDPESIFFNSPIGAGTLRALSAPHFVSFLL